MEREGGREKLGAREKEREKVKIIQWSLTSDVTTASNNFKPETEFLHRQPKVHC